MHRLVPDFIYEQQGDGLVEGRFEAVCLFVDTSGFTRLTTALMAYGSEGTEVLADVLAAVFAPFVELVYEQGGFVAGYAGDAFKAVFPVAKGVDVYERVVAVAWQIKQRMAARSVFETEVGTFELAVKAMIAAGEVVWGIWQGQAGQGRAQNAAYFFEGEGLARCLALDSVAAAGEVVVTTAVARQLSPLYAQLEPVADHFRLVAVAGELRAAYGLLPVDGVVVDGGRDAFFPLALQQMQTRGEFRQVVSLFVSLQWLPEATAVYETIFQLLARYGGYLCRVGRIGSQDRGGTLLFFWGAPNSYENSVARALGFILDLQGALPMPLKAGLTYNQAYAGFIGAAVREEYTCYGAYVNLAARQMVAAGWGEIWLDGETAVKVQSQFEVRLRGSYQFKGFAGKRLVYVVNGRRDVVGKRPHGGRFVGREREMVALRAAVESVRDGRWGGLVLVTGEAGLGKSRLVHEFMAQVAADFSLFLCQTDEILRQSLNPLRYWLRHYFEQTADARQNRENFHRILETLARETADPHWQKELRRTRSFLASLIDLYWPDSLYAQLEPKLRFANVLSALKTLIKAESLRRPVLLCFEDVHWLDEDSYQFLQSLLAEGEGYPVAVLATIRPQEAALVSLPVMDNITLSPLAAEALMELAETSLGGPVKPALVGLLVERAEGNPFFSEQLLLYMRENGFLWRNGAWNVTASQTILLPVDVRSLLVSRLDKLPVAVRRLVQTAAVLGREFSLPLLVQMMGEEVVMAGMETAVAAAIWFPLSENTFMFQHALLRDVAYAMQRHAQRRQLHQAAAEGLEKLYGAELQPHYADLAHHYEQAGIVAQATYYLMQAGRAASQAYENKQAIDYYSRALTLLPVTDGNGRYELLLAREGIYALLGDREREQQDLAALQQLVAELADPRYEVQVALRRAHYAFYTGDYDAAEEAAMQALQLATTAEDAHLIVEAYLQFGQSLWSHGQYEAATYHLTQARQLAESIEDERAIALALRLLGNVAGVQGRYAEANQCFEQSHQLSQKSGYRQNEAECLNGLGVMAYFQGDFARASEYHHQGLLARREIGDRVGEAKTLGNLADALFRQGITADVQSYYQESMAIRQEVDDKLGVAWVLGKLGELYWFQGDVAQARQNYEQALQIRQEVDNLRDKEWSLNEVAAVYRAQGDYRQAHVYHQQALELSLSLGDRDGEAYTRHHLGVLAQAMGDFAAAQAHYETALAIHRELNNHSGEALTLNCMALLATYQGDDERSLACSEQALALAEAINYRDYVAMACLFRGFAYIGLARWPEAEAALVRARGIRLALQQPLLALEAEAGLMLVAGEAGAVYEGVRAGLAQLDAQNVAILYDLPRLYLTYYRVLAAAGDGEGARAVLAWVYGVLAGRTAVLSAAEQERFWQNHPGHRAILAAWEGEGLAKWSRTPLTIEH
ncbi:MAG: tetratricopeptide repeat protein [Ardenticatenaceae bacterium]|nr:tetratricopeptide repeat protein [Ardenticatenaceae bacterium]